jgi:FYVE/RhoGEF/PH domain-containing protein 5/6
MPIISDADFRRIFNNLTELQALNEDLLQDFECRIEQWPQSQKIADVIAKKGPFLKLYNNYIREFAALTDHFEDCLNRLPKFKKLVADFESRDRCKNLRVQHYMLKPVQRLPQYRLLLEDYLKHLDPDGEDFDDTTTALRIVSEVAEQADNTIKQGVS